jgi:hypothetical protein
MLSYRITTHLAFVSFAFIVAGCGAPVLASNTHAFPSWLGEKDVQRLQGEVRMHILLACAI